MHGDMLDYRPLIVTPIGHMVKEPLPPRHRRKRRDDDGGINSPQASSNQNREPLAARGPEFDLEDASFPPLPSKWDGSLVFQKKISSKSPLFLHSLLFSLIFSCPLNISNFLVLHDQGVGNSGIEIFYFQIT